MYYNEKLLTFTYFKKENIKFDNFEYIKILKCVKTKILLIK